MRWKSAENSIEVDLSGIDFSWTPVVSDELGKHLNNDHPATVQVKLAVTRDFGKVSARGLIQSVDGINVHEMLP